MARPELTEQELDVAAQALVDHVWDGTQPGFDRKPPSWRITHVAMVKAVVAALPDRPSDDARELAEAVGHWLRAMELRAEEAERIRRDPFGSSMRMMVLPDTAAAYRRVEEMLGDILSRSRP